MKLLFKGALALMMLVIPVSVAAYSGVISVDTVEATPGARFAVPVRLANNDADLSAITIPLEYASPFLTIDSVSFVGTILTSEFAGVSDIDPVFRTVRITILPADYTQSPIPVISSAGGVLAKIFFRLSPSAGNSTIAIDSLNKSQAIVIGDQTIYIHTRVEVSDNVGAGVMLPGFRPGAVKVMVSTAAGEEEESGLPTEFSLSQNYPNPFNPSSSIEFALPRAGYIKLEVFNVLGERVALLAEGRMPAGVHKIEFDGANRPSGIYFYRLLHDGGAETRKMVLLK